MSIFSGLSAAEDGVGTGTAAVAVVGGGETELGGEDGLGGLLEQGDEAVAVDGDVGDRLSADDERGIVVLGSGVLDEEQGRRDGLLPVLADDVAVEEGLEVVVAVVGDLGGGEDGIDVGQGTEMAGSGLVVDDTDAFFATDGIGDAVETVNDATHHAVAPGHGDGELEAEDGEGGQAAVGLDEQADVADDDLTIDKLETIETLNFMICEELGAYGIVDGTGDGGVIGEESVEETGGDETAGEGSIEGLGGLVEDVAEETVVDEVFVGVVGFLEVADVTVEEAQLAAQVSADGRGTDSTVVIGETMVEDVEDGGGLVDGLRLTEEGGLAGFQAAEGDISSLHHQLEHEAGHLALLGIDGGVVVDDGDVVGALEKAVEVVFVDGHLIVDGGQAVGLTDGVGDERGVVDAARHVALVAGEEQHVVEVEVAGLEYTHDLDALGGFAVEGDGGRLHHLGDKALEGGHVDGEDAAVGEVAQAVEQGVHAEEGL